MVRRLLLVAVLVGMGWAVGRAQGVQQQAPDFELAVTSTADGRTKIECVRGCGLQWVERMVPNRAEAKPDFSFGCSNAWDRWPNGCPSGRLGGWIIK